MQKNRLLLFASVALIMAMFASCDSSEEAFEKAKSENTEAAYSSFILSHRHAKQADEARDSIIAIYRKRRIIDDIPTEHKDLALSYRLKELISERVDEEYQAAMNTNPIQTDGEL